VITKNETLKASARDNEKYRRIFSLFETAQIPLGFHDNEKKFTIDNYTIYYTNKLAALQTLEEVFINKAYYFHSAKINPFIVDAGSETGIATIFFKIFYPKAKILCFEPHPKAYEVLQKNININQLEDVTLVNAALAKTEGTAGFFGEIDSADPDTRGSSLLKAWGLQRTTSSKITVKTVKLSNYIKQPVDYLKLNVEGAEQQILEELGDKIKLIAKLLVKCHHSEKITQINDLETILDLLRKSGFSIKNKLQKHIKLIFPEITKQWVAKNDVQLCTLYLENTEMQKLSVLKDTSQTLRDKISALKIIALEKEIFLLRNIIDNIPSSIYWKDTAGNYLGHSAYAIQQLRETNIVPNATVNNIVGKSDYDIFTKKIADKYRENDLYVMQTQKESVLEEIIITPNNKKRVQLSSKKPLYDEQNELVGIIGSTVDITQHKRAQKLEIQLAEQEKFKQMAAQVAHDIGSPLGALQIIVDIRQDEIPEEPRIILRTAIARLTDIANNLLNYYRHSKPAEILLEEEQQKPLLLSLALSQILTEKKYQHQASLVEFDFVVTSECSFVCINVKQTAFKRMLSNLLNNAAEALEGKAGKVTLRLKVEKNEVVISIQDTGKGISPEIITKIMSNIEVATTKEEGHGIGLTQVREALQDNQGKMTIESELTKGTKINLTFPKIKPPNWIATTINLNKGDSIVILDDDVSIHNAWDLRFKDYQKDVNLKHFTLSQEAINFIRAFPERNKLFILADFELLKQKLNGLHVIALSKLKRSILVTSHYANQKVQYQAAQNRIKILPKQLAADIAIQIRMDPAIKSRDDMVEAG
jgi:FkbM family methyltransferase